MHVLQLFQCLWGRTDIALVQHVVPGLTASHIVTVKENSNWEGALHWVNWWIRPGHLHMLSQAFTEMSKEAWENAPSTTNFVERKNLDIKQKNPVDFKAAMIKSYKLDKSYCLHLTFFWFTFIIYECYQAAAAPAEDLLALAAVASVQNELYLYVSLYYIIVRFKQNNFISSKINDIASKLKLIGW